MNKYVRIFLGLLIFIFITYGCEKDYITIKSTGSTGTPGTPGKTDTISFSKIIVPIFQSKCIICHGNGGQTPNLATNPYQNLISGGYINTGSPASSSLYVIIHTTNMGGTTSTEQDEILNWIKQGALNN